MTTSPSHWKLIIDGIQYDEGGDIETKIVHMVTVYLTHFQLQYDGKWGTGLNVAKMKYYGNQSSL
jgi:hypothetical protein